jgi:hypothetical protein
MIRIALAIPLLLGAELPSRGVRPACGSPAIAPSAGKLSMRTTQDMDPGELEKAIGKAIDKGVDWLKKQQKPDGSFGDSSGPTYGPGQAYHNRPGNAALALLALLKSDVDPGDPVITKGFTFLYEYMQQKGNLRSNYDRGVTLMAVEARYEATVAAKLKKEGKKVTERAGDFKEPKYGLSGSDAGFVANIVKELANEQTKKGGWRYGTGFGIVGSDEDISATQIVLLGLKSATRMRVGVDPGVFQRAMAFVLDSQEKDGPKVDRPADVKQVDRSTYASMGQDKARGWAYELKSDNKEETTVTGSMTCAGITNLLICKSVIGKGLPKGVNEKVEQAVYDGFAWLYKNWTVEKNPFHTRSHYYFLYGLERVGTLGMYEKIGSHMWFKEGAQVLVKAQKDDGHWTDQEVAPQDLYASCFALLFLKRGTVPIGDVMTGDRSAPKK